MAMNEIDVGLIDKAIKEGLSEDSGNKGERKMARPSKKQKLIEKLHSEKDKLEDKLIKIDDQVIGTIDPSISEGQLGLMRIQRSAMMAYYNALDLRIKDLESDVQD